MEVIVGMYVFHYLLFLILSQSRPLVDYADTSKDSITLFYLKRGKLQLNLERVAF